MPRSQVHRSPPKAKQPTAMQVDAWISELKNAYYAFLEDIEDEALAAIRRKAALEQLEADRIPDEQLARLVGLPINELPELATDDQFILEQVFRQMDREGAIYRALIENHGCDRTPDCGEDLVFQFLCSRNGFFFGNFHDIPSQVEEVLAHLYDLRSAVDEGRK